MMINTTRCKTSGGHVGATISHVFAGKDNEEINVLRGSADELHDMADDAKIGGSMYAVRHFTISPEVEMSREQLAWTLDQLGQTYNFDPTDAVIVEHQKPRAGGTGYDRHWHVMASEYDIEIGRVMHSHQTDKVDERIARDTEREFGHPMVVGANQLAVVRWFEDRGNDGDKEFADQLRQAYEDRGKPRSSFTRDAFQAAKRQGLSLTQARVELKDLWKAADSGKAFKAAMEASGYAIERGEKAGVWLALKDGQLVGALDRLMKEKRGDVADRLQGVEPTSQQVATLPIIQVKDPSSKEARQPESTEASKHRPSIGHGGGGGPAASVDASDIAPIDPDKPGDFERFLRQFAADVEKKNAAAHQIQMAAIKRGSLGSAEAAQRLAAILQRALTHTIREGKRHARREERLALHDAAKLAAARRYGAAIEQFEQAWQSFSESLVDGRPVGDPSSDDLRPDVDDPDTRPAGPVADGLRGNRERVDDEQPVAASEPLGAARGGEREQTDIGNLREHPDRADRDQRQAIRNRVEASRREIELGRPDASKRLERLVVQSAAIARQQQNPQEQPETAHQRLKREFAEYRDLHKQREKERWSAAFSRQREIAGVARSLLQRRDGWPAPAAARKLRAATMATNDKLRDVLQKTTPTLDTYTAFVQRRSELGDPAARQVHEFIVKREQQKQALLAEVDRVRDDRLSVLSSDPWPVDRTRNAKILADDARRALEKPRARVLEKVAALDAAAERAETLIGPADRLAKSLGIVTERVRDAEATRNHADQARAKLEPAETYEFRVKAASATAEHTAQQRQAEHDKWRDQDVKKAERDLEIAHQIDAAIQSHDREICRCRSYADAVRIIEKRMKQERDDLRCQQRELERQQEENEPTAGFSLGPRMR